MAGTGLGFYLMILSMVEEKQVVGDLDRNCPVFASVFLMLLRCGEDIPQLA